MGIIRNLTMGKMTDDSCRTFSSELTATISQLAREICDAGTVYGGWKEKQHERCVQMMRHDIRQHVTTAAEGIPGELLPGRRSFGESTSSPNHQHATSLSAATAACLQHDKQTVKQRLGCTERLFYTSDARLVADHHRSGLALVMSALRLFFLLLFLLAVFLFHF